MHHEPLVPASRRSLGVSLLSAAVATSVLAAPMPALAGPSTAFAARPSPFAPSSVQLRSVMSFQPEEAEGGGGAAADAPAAEGEAPAAEGPTEATSAPAPAPAPVGPEPRKGLGLLISGAVVTGALGIPLSAAGVGLIVAGRAADDGSGASTLVGGAAGTLLLIPGIIALGVGVPMLAVGAVRYKKYRAWKKGQEAFLMPHTGRTAHGTWTAGFALHF